jgi:hypothetical protein
MAIGMSVLGASSLMQGGSVADQLSNETEEQRKKRLAMMEQARLLPTTGASTLGLGYGSALGQ